MCLILTEDSAEANVKVSFPSYLHRPLRLSLGSLISAEPPCCRDKRGVGL